MVNFYVLQIATLRRMALGQVPALWQQAVRAALAAAGYEPEEAAGTEGTA